MVRNKLNEIMKGATIKNLNNGRVVLSGDNGEYAIEASKGDSLEASYVGYNNYKWIFTDRIEYDIVMETVAGSLN
ncbi:MAG: hypothetical protein ACXVBR_12355, partial [Flavisolibacter sp.]